MFKQMYNILELSIIVSIQNLTFNEFALTVWFLTLNIKQASMYLHH